MPLQKVRELGSKAYGSIPRMLWTIVVGTMWGAGGAIAFGWILEVDGHFKQGLDDETKIMLAGSGLVAGYMGIRMLKALSDRLEKQIQEAVREQTSQIKKQIDDVSFLNTQYTAAMSLAASALAFDEDDKAGDGLRADALNQLNEVRPYFNDRRTLGIFIGRLYRIQGDIPKAIEVLEEFLRARLNNPDSIKKDNAPFYYNLACYRNLLASKSPTDKAEELRRQAWEELKKAIECDPELGRGLDDKKDKQLSGLEKPPERTFASIAK